MYRTAEEGEMFRPLEIFFRNLNFRPPSSKCTIIGVRRQSYQLWCPSKRPPDGNGKERISSRFFHAKVNRRVTGHTYPLGNGRQFAILKVGIYFLKHWETSSIPGATSSRVAPFYLEVFDFACNSKFLIAIRIFSSLSTKGVASSPFLLASLIVC